MAPADLMPAPTGMLQAMAAQTPGGGISDVVPRGRFASEAKWIPCGRFLQIKLKCRILILLLNLVLILVLLVLLLNLFLVL